MATYDPAILQQFADSLYARARTIVFFYGFLGFLFGVVLSLGLDKVATPQAFPPAFLLGVVIVFVLIGVVIGRDKAFSLKLEAQRTLCQMRIERNTAERSGDRNAPEKVAV